jgi:hypothetical protein
MITLIKRIIQQYDNLIVVLEEINNENKTFVEIANHNPERIDIKERMLLAGENLRRLEMAKAERNSLKANYLIK